MGEVNIRTVGVEMKFFDTNGMCNGEGNPLCIN